VIAADEHRLADTARMERIASDFVALGIGAAGQKNRRQAADRFARIFGGIDEWNTRPVPVRMAAPVWVRSFAAFAAVAARIAVDAEYAVGASSKWGAHHEHRDPVTASSFRQDAADLGFNQRETAKMWSKLAQIAVITGTTPAMIGPAEYRRGRQEFTAAQRRRWGHLPKSAATPLFGLDAVLFHRGQADQPYPRRQSLARRRHEIDWEHVAGHAPVLEATFRRYLAQLAVSLRPSSVDAIDITLRQFAGFLITIDPPIKRVADIDRAHIEAFKTLISQRGGYKTNKTLSKTTIGMRLGHLHAFFQRITAWDYHDAPPRVPVLTGDKPIPDKPLPRFLDDPSAAKLLQAARALPGEFDRLAVELLARTGMRKGELLGLTIDAVVQIGSAFWLRTPVGKMHNDRYIPLHPTLKAMIDGWLEHRPTWQSSDLLFTDRGRPIPPSRIDKAVRKAAEAAGLGHVHPHQLRHTLATQAINRGMSLEAIAALLGHKSLSMTLVYARIADRTVAEEYFKVTEKVEALYDARQPAKLPATDEGTQMRKLRGEMHRRMLGNGYCARPVELDCHFESICESCTFFVTTIEFRPTLQAQRDDADKKGQLGRKKIFDGLLDRLDQTSA
jgi:integrase